MPTGFSCSLLFWTPKKQLHFGPGKNWRNYNYLLLYLVQFGEINQISMRGNYHNLAQTWDMSDDVELKI